MIKKSYKITKNQQILIFFVSKNASTKVILVRVNNRRLEYIGCRVATVLHGSCSMCIVCVGLDYIELAAVFVVNTDRADYIR